MATRDLSTQYLRLRSAMHRKRGPEADGSGLGDTARIGGAGPDAAPADWASNMVRPTRSAALRAAAEGGWRRRRLKAQIML